MMCEQFAFRFRETNMHLHLEELKGHQVGSRPTIDLIDVLLEFDIMRS